MTARPRWLFRFLVEVSQLVSKGMGRLSRRRGGGEFACQVWGRYACDQLEPGQSEFPLDS